MSSNHIRLAVAAHELGHAVAWRAAGVPVFSITVRGERRVRGLVELDRKKIVTVAEMSDYLVGLFAGDVAGERWCEETRTPRNIYDDRSDEAQIRRMLRSSLAKDLSGSELRRAARRVVNAQWSKIERLAPTLAERGTLRL